MWRVVTRSVCNYQKSVPSLLKTCTVVTIMPFYAVAKGRVSGIFMTWPDCEAQVKGFPGARYKKFDTVVGAQDFIVKEGGNSSSSQTNKTKINSKSSASTSYSLKRPASSSVKSQRNSLSNESQKKSLADTNNESKDTIEKDNYFSDDSDTLDTIISKQMDDIEKRLKTVEKGVDKIVKKGSKKTILIETPQIKNRKLLNGEIGFEIDDDGFVLVYTDGACSANGRSGARAGLGVYWGDEEHSLNVSEPVSGRATNNCGEIQAATRAIKQAIDNKITKLAINTDSKFLINSVTKWMPGWKRKGWKLQSGKPVKNEIDFKDLDSVLDKIQIKWNYVEAHRGVHGNEMADKLAKAGATMYNK